MENNKKRATLAVLGVFALVIVVAGASYALFTYSRLGETNTTITSGDIEFSYLEGESVTLEDAFPVSDKVGANDTANMYEFTVKMSSSSSKVNAVYNVSLLTDNTGTNNFKNKEVKYNLEKNDSFVVGTSTTGLLVSTIEGFDDEQTSGIGTVLTNQEISANQTDKYKLRIWIDENVNYSGDIDSNGTMTGTKNSYTYSLKVKVDSTGSITDTSTREIATEKIIGLSSTNVDELMIVNQSATNQTPETTDYRYYGATPNNYVTFNNELWRIIGVFDVDDGTGKIEKRVKIIRNESIGNYSYDSSDSSINSGWGVNSWKDSDLMTLLNNGAYFNRTIGTCYNGRNNATISCDFTTTGLTETAKLMIDDAKWYTATANTNSSDFSTITSEQAYINERGTITTICTSVGLCNDTITPATSWTGKIGLMYPSDYGYASGSICTSTSLYSYSSTCKTTDWLFNYASQWTISPFANSSFDSFSFSALVSGYVYSHDTNYADGVRPATYLASDIAIASGTGTSLDPFTLTR